MVTMTTGDMEVKVIEVSMVVTKETGEIITKTGTGEVITKIETTTGTTRIEVATTRTTGAITEGVTISYAGD